MIAWLREWWTGEHRPTEAEVLAAEAELRLEVAKHSEASEQTKELSQKHVDTANGLIRATEHALAAVKRGENGVER